MQVKETISSIRGVTKYPSDELEDGIAGDLTRHRRHGMAVSEMQRCFTE